MRLAAIHEGLKQKRSLNQDEKKSTCAESRERKKVWERGSDRSSDGRWWRD